MIKEILTIKNKLGLHVWPELLLAQTAINLILIIL